jgi:RHH-type rel operon transcriptional repressor/antitoxin RelB
LLQQIVTDWLDDLEDHLLAKATMERVRRGEETIHPADAVRRSLGLDD